MKGGVAVQLALAAELERADARRHVGVLRPRGGRGRRSTGWAGSCGSTRTGSTGDFAVLGEPTERGHRGRLQRHAARRGAAHGRRRPLGAGLDGRQRDPRRRRGAAPARGVQAAGRSRSTGWSTARASTRSSSRAASPPTSSRTRCVVTVNYRFAPSATRRRRRRRTSRELFDGYDVEIVDAAPGARPGLDDPAAQEFAAAVLGDHRRRARGQVRLDRRRPVLRAGRPRGELRPRGPAAGPQGRRALRRRPDHPGARGAAGLADRLR